MHTDVSKNVNKACGLLYTNLFMSDFLFHWFFLEMYLYVHN